jgi:hypothetical protein
MLAVMMVRHMARQAVGTLDIPACHLPFLLCKDIVAVTSTRRTGRMAGTRVSLSLVQQRLADLWSGYPAFGRHLPTQQILGQQQGSGLFQ